MVVNTHDKHKLELFKNKILRKIFFTKSDLTFQENREVCIIQSSVYSLNQM